MGQPRPNERHFLPGVINLPPAPQIDSVHPCVFAIKGFQTVSSPVDDRPRAEKLLSNCGRYATRGLGYSRWTHTHTHSGQLCVLLQDNPNHALIQEGSEEGSQLMESPPVSSLTVSWWDSVATSGLTQWKQQHKRNTMISPPTLDVQFFPFSIFIATGTSLHECAGILTHLNVEM